MTPAQDPSSRRSAVGRWRSLRGRATAAFAALALLLSMALAAGVWLTVSQYLMAQRERATLAQASANADRIQRGLRGEGLSAAELLARLPREIGSTSLLVDRGEWSTTSLRVGRDDLPPDLRRTVLAGQASRQRIDLGDRTVMVVGVPLAGLDEAYFEVFPLDELERTYRTLGAVLVVGVVTVPGLALALGWWVTRPALRPLDQLAAAATAIAAGDLETRIDARGDPALAQIAASFDRTAATLQRRVRADARFAADVAHELRTPLTTMLGAASLVGAHRDRLPDDGREGLDLLTAEVDRFHRLVLDLLEISRVDAGSADLAADELRLADLVGRSLPEHLRSRLVVDPSAVGVVVTTDKRRLDRVVANLVDNAEKHGGGLVALTLTATATQARIVVDDAGPGVAGDDRERVFDRFARGRSGAPASTDGTGLGLSLVTRHLGLLGGTITVGDSPRGGARFVVTLPVPEQPCPG